MIFWPTVTWRSCGVRRTREMYGFRFADVWLRFPDYDDVELEATVLLDTLQSEAPALTKTQSDALFFAVEADYMDITVRRERLKKLKTDPYFQCLASEICLCRDLP